MCFFGLTFFTFCILGLFIIPCLAPGVDLGQGLISYDSFGFYETAKEQAEKIRQEGWSAWSPFPEKRFPSGCLSPFFVIFGTNPWALWAAQALFHSMNTLLVLAILLLFFPRIPSLLGALYYLFCPAQLEFTFSPHKDMFFSMGFFLVLWFILQIGALPFRIKIAFQTSAALLLGIFLVLVTRAYFYPVLVVGLSLLLLQGKKRPFLPVLGVFMASLFLLLGLRSVLKEKFHDKFASSLSPTSAIGETQKAKSSVSIPDQPAQDKELPGMATIPTSRKYFYPLDRWLWIYQNTRTGFNLSGGRTLVDEDFVAPSWGSLLFYIPRALQIGLLSPWPNQWGLEGSTPGSTLWKKMLFLFGPLHYVALVLIFYQLLRRPRYLNLWKMVLICLVAICFFSLMVSNVGTLSRLRSPFYLLLVSGGLATGAQILLQRRVLSHEKR